MILVLYNPELAKSEEFLQVRKRLKQVNSLLLSPLDEQELPSCKLARKLREEHGNFKFYVLATRLIDVQTAVNEGGVGIFISQGNEWEETKVREMNTHNKKLVSAIKEAVRVILKKETF